MTMVLPLLQKMGFFYQEPRTCLLNEVYRKECTRLDDGHSIPLGATVGRGRPSSVYKHVDPARENDPWKHTHTHTCNKGEKQKAWRQAEMRNSA